MAKPTLAARQALFARFIDDESFERELRLDPAAVAEQYDAPVSFAQWLAQLDQQRIASFRRSRIHKAFMRTPSA